MSGSLIEAEMFPDGSGRWVVHLDRDGMTICGKNDVKIRTNEVMAANCEKCLTLYSGGVVISSNNTRCNHSGSYTTFLRMVGYRPVRVYKCEKCGEQLAMDTLPQHLLRRMYPQTKREPIPSKLWMKVDFCVAIGGPSAISLSRVFFHSLNEVTTTFAGVTFHLVNRGVADDIFNEVCAMVSGCETYVRPPIPDSMMRRAKRRAHPIGDDLLSLDTEWTYEWMIKNCGNNQFVAMSHFDIFFVGDFLNYLRGKITPNTGMLGQHCPFMFINREAFSHSYFKFRCESGLYAVPIGPETKQCHLYYANDPRMTSNAMPIGLDNGELLELELRILGWDTASLREEFDNYFYHFTGGDRVVDGPELKSIHDRARMFIEEYNIPLHPRVDTRR